MTFSAHLVPLLDLLREVFPDGLADTDYLPLLAALSEDLSERNLAELVAELRDDERVVVANDAAAARSDRRPPTRTVDEMRARLTSVGWVFDED